MILVKGGKHKAYMIPDRWQPAIKAAHPLPAIPYKVQLGGRTWKWLTISDPITQRIVRFWSPWYEDSHD